MIRSALMTLLLTLPLQFAAAAEPIKWKGQSVTEVRSMSELPQFLRDRFKMDAPPPAGVMDIGKPIITGDVVLPGMHYRGLVGAGHSGNAWLLVIAQGMNMGGVVVMTYVFDGSTLVRQERGGHWGSPDAFASTVAWLNGPSRPSAQLGGISIGNSEQQVEASLGRPAEVIAHKPTYIGTEPQNLPVWKELLYPGLSVQLDPAGSVVEITATGGNYCQTGKICLGTTAATVQDELRALGIWSSTSDLNGRVYDLRHESLGCWAEISYNSGAVSKIKVKSTDTGIRILSFGFLQQP